MKSLKNTVFLFAISLSSSLCLYSSQSQAQLEVGVMGIFQNGKQVGEIYVPARNSNDVTYAEHWLLYPDYIYPSKYSPGLETTIIPLVGREGDPWPDPKWKNVSGTRRIEVLSHEIRTK